MLELKANPRIPAQGVVLEAYVDKGRGPVANLLVKNGTLRTGSFLVAGEAFGKVRAMTDDRGKQTSKAGPSTPVEVLGLSEVPQAGDVFDVVTDAKVAQQLAERRKAAAGPTAGADVSKIGLNELMQKMQQTEIEELRLVVKTDVQGSAEALGKALVELSSEKVRVNVVHCGVGAITESDVMLASASNAIVIGFSIRPETKASDAAEREGVELRLYTVIYDAINEIRDAMEGLLEPTYREKVVGRAEVRQVFTIPGAGAVAGCFVQEGNIRRNTPIRLVRDHVVVHQGKIGSLRRFKEDAREVQSGYECGIGLEGYQDVKTGDIIEAYELEQIARRLTPSGGRASAERAV
jgi:translation initiation factor IF-2